MSGTENKSVKTHPALEQEIISTHEKFGWSLVSSQELLSQTSHTSEDSVFVYHHTTTTNYVKLIFSRNRDIPNREKVVALEKEYWDCFDTFMSAPNIMPGKIFWIIAAVLCVPGLIMLMSGAEGSIAAIPSILLGLAPIILRHICYYMPRKKQANECADRSDVIEEEIENLLKS